MDSLDNLLLKIEKSQNNQERAGLGKKFLEDSIGTAFSGAFVFYPKKEHNRGLEETINYILDVVSKGNFSVLQDINRLRKAYSSLEIKNVVLETYKNYIMSEYSGHYEFITETLFVDYLINIKEKINNFSYARKLLRNIQKQIIFYEKYVRNGTVWKVLTPIDTILEYEEKNSSVFIEKLTEIFMKDENPSIRLNKLADLISKGQCRSAEEVCEVATLDLPEGYKPIRKLGKGGSGSVYLVENTIDKLEEAVKILTLSSDKGPEDVRRAIESELQVRRLNKMRCPYITMYYSVTYRNGKYLISMEPFEKTLEERMSEVKGRLPLYEATRYYEQLCHVLALCHKNNIIHKDLAPHNIGIDAEGNIKLSDFGNPLTTMDKKLKQPPLDYSSPRLLALPDNELEVLKDDNVWALGVILYEMLTGEKPFSSKDIERSDRKTRKEYIRDQQNKALQDNFNKLISQIDISDDAAEEWFQVNKGTFWPQYRNFNLMYERDSFNQEHADFDLWQISKHLKAEMIKEVLKKELLDLFDQISEHKEKYNIYETRFTLRLILNLNKYRSESIPENKEC